jgi:coatomer protein complex subunit gamma
VIFPKNDSMYSLSTFEHKLVMYVTSDDKQVFSKAFDISTVPVVSHEQALAEERTKKLTTATPTLKAPSAAPTKPAVNGSADSLAATAANAQKYLETFSRIPEIEAFGPVLKSSQTVALTESETEYVVSAVKHVFKDYFVIQYDIKNTLPNTVLDEVTVVTTPSEEDEASLEEEFIIPAPRLATNEPGTVYVAFKKLAGEHAFPITSFTNVLRFTTKEIDPTSGEAEESGYEDEYQVEDLDLSGADYVIPAFAGSFDHVWEGTGANGEEASETLQLANVKSLSGTKSFFISYELMTWLT